MKPGLTRLSLIALLIWTPVARAQTSDAALVARGHYLAVAADCKPCHTSPGQMPFSGGRAIDTPFGVIMSANITPDRDTGIGAWSEDDFVSALQRGKSHGGKHIYPAMPYPYFSKMSRGDIHAVYAYLRTVTPVTKAKPANKLPFPFNLRILMSGWNLLFFKPEPFRSNTQKSAEWNRGAYLVQGPGHCGACHTPKNFLGADKKDHALEGASLQYWWANNLHGDSVTGLGEWSLDDVIAYLTTGHNRFGGAGATMAEVVTNSTSLMTAADVHAIAVYLKDLPIRDVKPAPRVAASDGAMQLGRMLYVDNCAGCHGLAAGGATEIFPMLKDNSSVRAENPTTLVRVVLEGTQTAATDTNPTATAMPAFGWKLDDAQIASVLTYIRNSWKNTAAPVSANDVAKIRKRLPRPQ
jgi:mono/diheme cytochrome c family protein